LGYNHFTFPRLSLLIAASGTSLPRRIPLRTAMRYDRLVAGGGVMIAGNAPAVLGTRDYAGSYPKRKGIEEVYQDSPPMHKSTPEKEFSDVLTRPRQENHSSMDLLFEISDRLVDLSNLVSSAQVIRRDNWNDCEMPTHDEPPEQPLSTSPRLYPPLMLVEEIPEVEVDAVFIRQRNSMMVQDRRSQRNLHGSQAMSTRNLYDEGPLEATGMGYMEPLPDVRRMSIHGTSSHRRPFARQDSFQSHTSHNDYRGSSLSSASYSRNAYHNEGPVGPQSNFALTRQPSMQRASSFRRRGSYDSSMEEMSYRNGPSFENPQQYLDTRSQHSIGPRHNVPSMDRAILEESDASMPRNHLYADDVRSSGYPPPDGGDQYSNVSNRNSRNTTVRRYGDARVEYNPERHITNCATDNPWNNGNSSRSSYQRPFSRQHPSTYYPPQFMTNRPELSGSYHHPSRPSFSSTSEPNISSRVLPQTTSCSSVRPPATNGEGRRTIEISPGLVATIRGAEETKQAIARNFVIYPDCMSCNMNLTCIADADYVICPDCKVISPSGSNIAHSNDMDWGGGVGLGLRTR
jgi:hypothetical protein